MALCGCMGAFFLSFFFCCFATYFGRLLTFGRVSLPFGRVFLSIAYVWARIFCRSLAGTTRILPFARVGARILLLF
jgi:hypothetical protein